MYSIVLMAALTTGSATPNWPHYGAYCGYHGNCGSGHCGSFGAGYGGGYEGCGCWGGYSRWSYCEMPNPGIVGPGMYGMTGGMLAPGSGAGGEQLHKPKTNKSGARETMVPSSARILVELPTNAKLFVDDRPVKAAAGLLTLGTPPLEPGEVYFYMVRIERMHDGQPHSETRRILVRAGQVARADFKDLELNALKTAQAK